MVCPVCPVCPWVKTLYARNDFFHYALFCVYMVFYFYFLLPHTDLLKKYGQTGQTNKYKAFAMDNTLDKYGQTR